VSARGGDVHVLAVPYDSAHRARRMGAGPEADLLAASGLTHLRADEAATRLDTELDALGRRVGQLFVHIDLDVLDASEGRVNGFPGGPGLSRAGLLGAIGAARRRCRVAAAAITAYDPQYDADGRIARTAVDVALALVGASAPRSPV